MPSNLFFRLPEERRRPVGFMEAAIAEAIPYRTYVVPEGREAGLGTMLGAGVGGYAQLRALSHLLKFAPHPVAKAAGLALPILIGAVSGFRGMEEASPQEKAAYTGLGALLGSPLPGKALQRLRGKKTQAPAEARLAPGTGLSFPEGSTMAQVWRAILEGQPRANGGALAIPGRGAGEDIMAKAGRSLEEMPTPPGAPKPTPALMRPRIEGFPPGTMGEQRVLPGFEPQSPFERALYGEFPRRAARAPGGPAVPSVGTQYDAFLSQPTKEGGPRVHSSDYGRWQQWKRARNQGKGPLVEWPEEAVREAEVRVVYNGERLQGVMSHITNRLAKGEVKAPSVAAVSPAVSIAQEVAASPVLPEALTKHSYYPTLRQIVSQAFSSRLENPALALGQADAFLSQMVAGMGDADISKAAAYLMKQQKRLGGVSPDEVFATLMRGFGKLPRTAATGRAGVKARAVQAAQAEGQAQRAIPRTIGDLLNEWSDPQVWGPALEKMGFRPDSFSAVGLLTRLGGDPELLKQPASMLPRLIAKITAENPVPLSNALDRPGLERFLGHLFQERITPEMLRGLPDESLQAALRSAETMLMDGHSIQRAADMAALHLGAPNASRLLMLPGRDAWKSAVLTGDTAPVFLKALSTAFGRFGLKDQDIMRLAESLATSEGTSVENALGYLAYKARLPVDSIENKVAQQYLKQLQRQGATDPSIRQVFEELEQDLTGVSERTRKGIQVVQEGAGVRAGEAEADLSIDDLVPRTARQIEEEGLIEDPEDIIQAVIGVGRQVEQAPEMSGIEQLLGEALSEAGFRRRPARERAKLAKDVLRIIQGPGDEAAKLQQAKDIVKRYAAVVRRQP